MLQSNKHLYTVDEYFALEEQAEYKHEYFDGEIFAMAGGTPNHNRIMVDITTILNSVLRDTGYEAFASDLRVQIDEQRHYTYADVVVVCGALEFAKGRKDTLTNPVLIAEVLSDSTRDYDRGTKFSAYRKIATLREYLLIEQKNVQIEHFSKEEDGSWRLREYTSLEDTLYLSALQSRISVKEIYRRVTPLPAFHLGHSQASEHDEEEHA